MNSSAVKWLTIMGIGEDGTAGLSNAARHCLEKAEVIIGGDRHHALSENTTAKRISWPSPFDAMIDEITSHKGRRIVILVTGDPLWYSVGARILKAIPAEEVRFFPQLSAFQWASCRMGWSLADCETLTVHGRAVEQIIPHIAPDVRMLVLTRDGKSPEEIADILCDRGFGKSRLTVLANLGGDSEQRFDGIAEDWSGTIPDFHTLAVECIADETATLFSRTGGLPDEAFIHDGQLTKQVIRTATLSALQPYPDALLWDVGAGCGSIAVEWMRSCRGAQAIAIESNMERCGMIGENARNLGTPKLSVIEGQAPDALAGLEMPDAVFIGGGITSEDVFNTCWEHLRPLGRLVANVVTVEGEAMLFKLHEKIRW